MAIESEKISLQLAREAASEACPSWQEVYINETSQVISFERSSMGIAYRLNVYYTSGTIGTALEHPTQGKTQLFRVECDLDLLKEVMANPRLHTERGYQRRGNMPVAISVPFWAVPCDLGTEEESLEEHLRALDRELDGIAAHRESLSKRLAIVRGERVKEEQKESQDVRFKEAGDEIGREKELSLAVEFEKKRELYEQTKERESRLKWSLAAGMNEMLKHLPLREVRCLTITPNGKGCLYSMHNGQSFWKFLGPPSLPMDVDNALRTRIGEHCRPEAITLGSFNRYFMQFANGKALWNGDDEFIAAVDDRFDVKMVAFGKCVGSFVVLYNDGSVTWREIPKQLKKCFAVRKNSLPKPDYVSLGLNGEFFVRFKDGSTQYAGVSSEVLKALGEIKGDMREVTFGDDNSFIARYNPH